VSPILSHDFPPGLSERSYLRKTAAATVPHWAPDNVPCCVAAVVVRVGAPLRSAILLSPFFKSRPRPLYFATRPCYGPCWAAGVPRDSGRSPFGSRTHGRVRPRWASHQSAAPSAVASADGRAFGAGSSPARPYAAVSGAAMSVLLSSGARGARHTSMSWRHVLVSGARRHPKRSGVAVAPGLFSQGATQRPAVGVG